MIERQLEARDRGPSVGGRNADRHAAINLNGEGRALRLRQILHGDPVEAGRIGALDRHARLWRLALRIAGVKTECQAGLMVARLEMPPPSLADADLMRQVIFEWYAGGKPAAAGIAKSRLKPIA